MKKLSFPITALRRQFMTITFAALLGISVILTFGTLAASGYELDWWTVDTGGASDAFASGYTLYATIGQPESAPIMLQGGNYILASGFWDSPNPPNLPLKLMLPLVTR